MSTVLPSGSTNPVLPVVAVQPVPRSAIEPLVVTVRRSRSDVIVVGVRGEVDMVTSPFLQDTLLAHLHDTVRRVIIDFTGVSFLGAAGLTVLVNVKQAAVAAGTDLCLVAGRHVVLLPLRITGLDSAFDIQPELAGAPLRQVDGTHG